MAYDNVAFKSWLPQIGNVRRKIMLKKLMKELRDNGLSTPEVYKGLVQLASNTRIILPRLRINEVSHLRLKSTGSNLVFGVDLSVPTEDTSAPGLETLRTKMKRTI